MVKFLKLSFLLGAQLSLGYPSSTTEKLIQCLDDSKVPQAYSGTPEFAISAKPHNIRMSFTPKAIAVPRTVAHVQSAVACGKKLGVKVNARSGGHSYASHGIGGEDGHLVIDMKYFNDVKVDTKSKQASVGTGTRIGNLALALDEQGKRAIPHGICPKVGVGGHVLHGGWGYSTHNHGLFLDYLEEAEIVLANSSVVTASQSKNEDLFWALRGAGNSYGIATTFKFRTIPQPKEVQLFYLPFVWDLPQSILGWKVFQEYSASRFRPKEMNIRVVISDAIFFGLPGKMFLFEGAFHGSKKDYHKFIKPFVDGVLAMGGYLPSNVTGFEEVTSVNYIDALAYANNNKILGFGDGNYEPLKSTPDEQIQINGYMNSMFTNKLADETVDIFMAEVNKVPAFTGTQFFMLIIAAIGGPNSAISKVKTSSTSYAHRDKLLIWEIGDAVIGPVPYPNSTGIPFVQNFVKQVQLSEQRFKSGKIDTGAYYNYADPELGDHKEAGVKYWGKQNYDRLSGIKGRWDPGNVFENPQSVRGRE